LARVLQVIATLDPAGAERQMVELCRRLDRREFQPAVCCLTRGGPLEAPLKEAGVPLAVLFKRGRWDLGVMERLSVVIRDFRPEILHTWLPTSNTLGRLAGVLAGVPVLIASERAADVWKGSLMRWADRLLTRRSAAVVTNAQAVRRFLVERVGLPEEKVVVVRNGLDLDEFDARARGGPAAPLPARGSGPLVGTVARLEKQKGLEYLLRGFALLPPELDQAHLWVVGGGPLEGDLRRLSERLGLGERVRFLGVRHDVPALMREFDLFVLPSLWEGLPNAVLEAMAAGRAVVATAVHGTPEAVAQGETGLLVPPRDPQALAGAMARLLKDDSLRGSMGRAGRERVAREFGMDRMVRETEEVYRRALARIRERR